jgi:hypothetical protein
VRAARQRNPEVWEPEAGRKEAGAEPRHWAEPEESSLPPETVAQQEPEE